MFEIRATATFEKALRQQQHNAALLREVDRKLARLQIAPDHVGGALSGKLHGYHPTRVLKRFRLIFSINAHYVTLHPLNHRKDAYH